MTLNMRMMMIIMVMSRMVMIIMVMRLMMMIQIQVLEAYGRDEVNATGVEAGSEKVGMYELVGRNIYEHVGTLISQIIFKNIKSLMCLKMLNALRSRSVDLGGSWIWTEQTSSRILPVKTLVAIICQICYKMYIGPKSGGKQATRLDFGALASSLVRRHSDINM